MNHQFSERAVPGIGRAEVCENCGLVRRRRSKAVPWSYFRSSDKEPIGQQQPVCHRDPARSAGGECVYCFGEGFVVDTEEVTWPCPQRCEAGAEQPQRFIVSEVVREVGIVRLVTLNAEDVRELQPGDEVTLTRGVTEGRHQTFCDQTPMDSGEGEK